MTLSAFAPNPNGDGGTIVIFLNGQPVANWNGIDSNGKYVPNSYYHFVMKENAGAGNTILLERDAFVAPYHGETVSFGAMPNVAHPGDTILFSASFGGVAADGQSKIRLYAVSGELLQTLSITNGIVSWDLRTTSSQLVASGVYLAVLEGINPTNGQKSYKITKVLVTH